VYARSWFEFVVLVRYDFGLFTLQYRSCALLRPSRHGVRVAVLGAGSVLDEVVELFELFYPARLLPDWGRGFLQPLQGCVVCPNRELSPEQILAEGFQTKHHR